MRIKLMLGIFLFGISLPVVASQGFDFAPYLGIDVKQHNMQFKQNAGANLVQKNYPQGNLFAGIRFNECLAMEFGYEGTAKKTKTAFVPLGASFFGDVGLEDSSTTKTRIAGPHIDVLGFYPIFEERYCLDLFGSFGLANLKFKSRLDVMTAGDPEVSSYSFLKRKLIPRVTLGVQHMINNNLGVRAMATWERTSSFKNIYADRGPLYMRPKDSRSLGVGVFYSF